MRGWWFCLLLALLFGLHPVEAQQSREARKALQSGRNALRKLTGRFSKPTPLRRTYPLGCRALTAYGLLEAGLSPQEPKLVELFESMKGVDDRSVYSRSLHVLALDAYWRSLQSAEEPSSEDSLSSLSAAIRKHAEWLLAARGPLGLWSYGPAVQSSPFRRVDLSNSAYAVMALQVSRRHGVQIPDAVPRELLETLLQCGTAQVGVRTDAFLGVGWWGDEIPTELADTILPTPQGFDLRGSIRTWPYELVLTGKDPEPVGANWTSTVSAVGILLHVREWLPVNAPEILTIDRAITGGLLAIFRDTSQLFRNPRQVPTQNYYYSAFALERVLDLSGIESFGGQEWFQRLSSTLTKAQGRTGTWQLSPVDPEMVAVNTAFAVLTLSRAGRHLRGEQSPAVTQPGSTSAISRVRPAKAESPAGQGSSASRDLKPETAATPTWAQALRDLGASRTPALLKEITTEFGKLPETQRRDLLDELLLLLDRRADSVDEYARQQIRLLAPKGLATDTDFGDWLYQSQWLHLKSRLELSEDPVERALLRNTIATLGQRVLPHIEGILDREQYLFDWVLIRARITGESLGLPQ